MYSAYGLLRPDSNFTLSEAVTRLKARFPTFTVSLAGDQITVASDDWEIALGINSDPSVLAESAELAEKIAGLEDGQDIAGCARRVEVSSDTPDPMMEHFNDFLFVIEVLQSFSGVIAIDPREPALM